MAGAILFSLMMASIFGFAGLLVGSYLFARFGPLTNSPDQIGALMFGILVGVVAALIIFSVLLWKFWPHYSGSKNTMRTYR